MKSISWVGLLFIIAFVVGMGLISGCQGMATKSDAMVNSNAVKAKTSTGVEAVEVKDLDDPQNPYIGQYREWDLWVFANMVSMPKAWKLGEYPEEWGTLSAEIDENGYFIPMLESIRRREQAISDGTIGDYNRSVFKAYGDGEISRDMESAYFTEAERIRAQFVPSIPSWLAQNPPAGAMLFPNGDVITSGKLGSTDNDRCSGGQVTWYRYSNNGELTGQSKVAWWDIYYTEKYGSKNWPDGDFENRMDGYIFFKDRVTGQILSAWDYDGTKLELEVPPPFRDPHPFMFYNAGYLSKFHDYQNS